MGFIEQEYGVQRARVWGSDSVSMGFRQCEYGVQTARVWSSDSMSAGVQRELTQIPESMSMHLIRH
jgi:hypothetical protein